MQNGRSLRQTLRRPKTDEEIFDRVTPAKHSRSTSLLDIHSSKGIHRDREASGEHDTRAQKHESRSLGSQQSELEPESDSDEPLSARSPQRLTMAPMSLRNESGFSPSSALSAAYMGSPLDDYSITPFLDENWPEQLTQWDSSVNRHARFASEMESSSGDEKYGSKEAQKSKPISWSTHLSVSEKLELLDRVGAKEKRRPDETELRYLDRVMGLLRLTAQEKEHARALVIARQDFDREEDEMLSHYRLDLHANFLRDPRAAKKMTTEDKENLLEKHAGPAIAAAHAKFVATDKRKMDAYWKYCGLHQRSWSRRDDAKNGPSHPPTRKRKGSFGEDEFETYTKAFAAQRQNAARFEGKPLTTPEKKPNTFRPFNSPSPDYLSHKYALSLGYTHVSQHTPPASSRLVTRVSQRSPQPAPVSSKSGGGGSRESDFSAAVGKDPFMQRSHQQPSHQQPSHQQPSHHQPPHQAPRQNCTTRGGSHDHQHPQPTTTASSSSSSAPGHGRLSGDMFAKAHLDLPRMPPGLDSIFSLKQKAAAADHLEQRPRK